MQKIHVQPEARVDDFVQRKGQVFFFVVIIVSVDGKEA